MDNNEIIYFEGSIARCSVDLIKFKIEMAYDGSSVFLSVVERGYGTPCYADEFCQVHQIELDLLNDDVLREDGYCKDCNCPESYFDGPDNKDLEIGSIPVPQKPKDINYLKEIALKELRKYRSFCINDEQFKSIMKSNWVLK